MLLAHVGTDDPAGGEEGGRERERDRKKERKTERKKERERERIDQSINQTKMPKNGRVQGWCRSVLGAFQDL
jgi:hypothetical protein